MNKKVVSVLLGFGLGLASLVSTNVNANHEFCYEQYEICADGAGSHMTCYPAYVDCMRFSRP